MGRAIDVNSHEMYVNKNTISEIVDNISSVYASKGMIVCVNEHNARNISNEIRYLCRDRGIRVHIYDWSWSGECYYKCEFDCGGVLYLSNRKHSLVENIFEYYEETRLYDCVLIGWCSDLRNIKSYGIGLKKAYELLKPKTVDISEEELNDISDLFV